MPFNLVTTPWIPVRRQSGQHEVIRPAEIAATDDPPMALAWLRPDFNLAGLELLIGLVRAAAPPRDAEDWLENRPDGQRLVDALARLAPAFDLDGGGDGGGPAFLQDAEPLDGKPNGVDMLLIDSAGGNAARNNADLMVRRDRYGVFCRAYAAMALYTLQAFAPSGGAGNRTSMRGGGPLVTLVEPRGPGEATLWETVWANVPDGRALSPNGLDAFPWMRPTRTSVKGEQTHDGDTPVPSIEALFGMPRRLRLVFEPGAGRPCDMCGAVDAVVVTGVVQRPHGTNYGLWRHPLTPYYRLKEGAEPLPLHPRPGGFGYRNWIGVAVRDLGRLRDRAETVETFVNHRIDWHAPAPALLVGGWAMDNMKPVDFVLSRQPLPVAADPEAAQALEEACVEIVQAGVEANRWLMLACRNAFGRDGADTAKGDFAAASERFYAATEGAFVATVNALSGDPHASDPRRRWADTLRDNALREFERLAVPGVADASGGRAADIVQAHRLLRAVLSGYGKGGAKFFDLLRLPPPGSEGVAA